MGLGIVKRNMHEYFYEGDRKNIALGGLDTTLQRLRGQRTVLTPFLRH